MNTFDLLIYAIAAIALVAVFLALAQNFPGAENNSTLIKKSLDEARLDPNLGKTFLVGTLNYEKNNLMSSSGLAPQGVLLSIECINPDYCCVRKSQQIKNQTCDKYFEWDYDYMQAVQTKKINTFVRCVDIEQINTCKVFVGTSPAQAEIESVENIGENSMGNTEIKVTLTNSGTSTLAQGSATLKLYKKASEKWIQTNYETDVQEVELIQPNEKKILYWEVNPANLGEYRATIKFEANNAGFNERSVDFNKMENNFCTATGIGETVYSAKNNNYKELHTCEGCNDAYECVNAWNKKNAITTFLPESKDYAYCVKSSENGSC